MRTTLVIDNDVLDAAKAIAGQQRRLIGDIMSELARQSLRRPIPQAERNGIPLLPVTTPAARVTLEMVNALRDEEA